MEKRTLTVGELQQLLDSFKQRESEKGTFAALQQSFEDAFQIGFNAGQKHEKTLQQMGKLTSEQLTALIEFLEVSQAYKSGTTTEEDVMRCISSLSKEDVGTFYRLLSMMEQ